MRSPAMGTQAAPDEVHWNVRDQNAVAISWRGTSNALRYGTTTAYGTTVDGVAALPPPLSSPGPFWEARLTGLAENTIYHYSLAGGPDHTFRTPPPRGSSDFTVYVEADIGDSRAYPRMLVVQSQIAADLPRFVLAPGDLTYANDHGQAAVDQHFNDVMVWSQDAAYMPAWGNHDWEPSDSLRNYKGRFDLPNPRVSPGSPAPGEDWYWFDYGNARFIAYPEPWTGAWSDWRTRATAVMDSAQQDPDIDFIVTFGHRPAYSSGHHAGSPTLKSYLDALGSTHSKYVLNLNGHSHDYERTYPQSGVTHITAGGGGASLEAEPGPCLWAGGCPAPSWSAFRAMHHGPVRLRFTQTAIEGTAICGPPGGDASNPNDITCTQGSAMDQFVIGSLGAVPPAVYAPASALAEAGIPLTVLVSASDPNGDSIGSLVANLTGLPSGHNAVFTAGPGNTSGTLTWTPAVSHIGGPYPVTFTAANALSGAGTTSITVRDPAPNLVGNPSFESGMTGWRDYHGSIVAPVSGGHDGLMALRATGPAARTADFGVNDSPNWIGVVAGPGVRYRFRAWARSTASRGAIRLQVREYKNGVQQGALTLSPALPLSSAWQLATVDYVTTTDGSTIDFQIIDEPLVGGETFDVDGLSIQVIPPASVDVPDASVPAGGAVGARFAPNPTRRGGILAYDLARPGAVRIEVLDLQGRRLRRLAAHDLLAAGKHTVDFDGRGDDGAKLDPGVYFVHVRSAAGAAVVRVLILR